MSSFNKNFITSLSVYSQPFSIKCETFSDNTIWKLYFSNMVSNCALAKYIIYSIEEWEEIEAGSQLYNNFSALTIQNWLVGMFSCFEISMRDIAASIKPECYSIDEKNWGYRKHQYQEILQDPDIKKGNVFSINDVNERKKLRHWVHEFWLVKYKTIGNDMSIVIKGIDQWVRIVDSLIKIHELKDVMSPSCQYYINW